MGAEVVLESVLDLFGREGVTSAGAPLVEPEATERDVGKQAGLFVQAVFADPRGLGAIQAAEVPSERMGSEHQ